jgi:hypothetical protein
MDWTADYRVFRGKRMDMDGVFGAIRKEAVGPGNARGAPITAHMDDTRIKKTGKKTYGTSWARDPLGPPFQTNLIWSQRFIGLSISRPEAEGPCRARAIPVDFHHCPTVKKPKKDSDEETVKYYKEAKAKTKPGKVGSERISLLRDNLDLDGHGERKLVISVDGGYTNENVLKKLPANTTLIGRIRKDARLNAIPEKGQKGAGRNRVYGDKPPTPEQVRQSGDRPWEKVTAWAAGKAHEFSVKVVKDVRWRKAGKMDLQLVVIRPLAYRLNSFSKPLYRNPAYLICTDNGMDIKELLQSYLWRWEIEVNIRDQKTLMGCGQAQVRKEGPVEKVPAFVTAAYSMLLLAYARDKAKGGTVELPRAKWYKKKPGGRVTTGDLINRFRATSWSETRNIDFSDFVNLELLSQSRGNTSNKAYASILYSRN